MASVTVQARDKKMIIWNFMEEFCRKYNEATNDGRYILTVTGKEFVSSQLG
jgi:hypothetical protein